MNLTISALGLTFDAECTYRTGRPGTYWEPPEPAELQIDSLTYDGCDASFLLESAALDEIYDAAYTVVAGYEADRRDAACEARRDMRLAA